MSKPYVETLRCPECDCSTEFTCYSSVNATHDPALKEALLRGELTRFTCPGCGHPTNVSFDLLYHDMRGKRFIWLKYPDEGVPPAVDPRTEPMFELAEGYTFRLVTSLNELLEKIRLFDDGYDDVAMEVLKLLASVSEQIDLAHPLLYDHTERSLFGKKSLVLVELLDEDARTHSYPLNPNYTNAEEFARRLQPRIERSSDRWLQLSRSDLLEHMQAAGWMRRVG
jgi:hypothetical protein